MDEDGVELTATLLKAADGPERLELEFVIYKPSQKAERTEGKLSGLLHRAAI